MEQENDFIEREVQKIILFLQGLLAKISNITKTTEKGFVKGFDIELKEKIAIGFYEILSLEKEELKAKIKDIDVLILDDLVIFFNELNKNKNITLNKTNLERTIGVIIEFIDDKTRVFSFERHQIKNNLKL